ncbi:MAG TPA: hypothetical protein VJ045_01635 [Hyphomicrobiaceae bacterium]|nr:hypothetical protein [Hyphomicrobiaceae bacterium]
MFDARLQTRFVRSYTDAVFGYTHAVAASYAAFTEQTLTFWASAAATSCGASGASDSNFSSNRAPAASRAAYPAGPFSLSPFSVGPWPNPALEMMKLWRWGAVAGISAAPDAISPFAAWWGMLQPRGSPEGWPMAFMLMAAGVPRSVAWPTAQANVAALDAAEAATASFNNAFSSYRSEGGHAVVQLASPRRLLAALFFAPFGAAFQLPSPFSPPGTWL